MQDKNVKEFPAYLICLGPNDCSCLPGICSNAKLKTKKCPKCGSEAAIFICSHKNCPVNGGAYHG